MYAISTPRLYRWWKRLRDKPSKPLKPQLPVKPKKIIGAPIRYIVKKEPYYNPYLLFNYMNQIFKIKEKLDAELDAGRINWAVYESYNKELDWAILLAATCGVYLPLYPQTIQTNLVKPSLKSWFETRNEVLRRDNYKCKTCGSSINLEVHHIIPKHRGGSDDLDNLITLCEECHKAITKAIEVRSKVSKV